MLCINGLLGTGKTRLVTELSRYLTIRNTFPDGVFYIDFLKAKTIKDMNSLFLEIGFEKLVNEKENEWIQK